MRVALAAFGTLFAASACAQFSGSIAVESDQRFRGVSLSDGKPDLRLSLAYDVPNGWYGGASATGVEFEREPSQLELLVYAGHVWRAGAGANWELGVTAAHFSGGTRYDYQEVFAGLLAERWSARVYYSPDYYSAGIPTVYAELNGGVPLRANLRAFGHVGALSRLRGGAQRTRIDLRAGLALARDAWELQLAWHGIARDGSYPSAYERQRTGWVLGAIYSF
jgi:uncharacterized protein (TIGR02001 family)